MTKTVGAEKAVEGFSTKSTLCKFTACQTSVLLLATTLTVLLLIQLVLLCGWMYI